MKLYEIFFLHKVQYNSELQNLLSLEQPSLALRVFLFLLGYFPTNEYAILDFC